MQATRTDNRLAMRERQERRSSDKNEELGVASKVGVEMAAVRAVVVAAAMAAAAQGNDDQGSGGISISRSWGGSSACGSVDEGGNEGRTSEESSTGAPGHSFLLQRRGPHGAAVLAAGGLPE